MAASENQPKPQCVEAPDALRGLVQGLHHVAIAVRSLAEAQEYFATLELTEREAMIAADGASYVLIDIPEDCQQL